MKRKLKEFFTSMGFRTWLYFVLFALSIILLLQLFQLVMLEPNYKHTLKNTIMRMSDSIAEIYFSDDERDIKDGKIYSLTSQNNACIVIYNKDTEIVSAYDVLGENQCAIYSNGTVNPTFVSSLDNPNKQSIYEVGSFLALSSQEVMVYGQKYEHNNSTYYIISNFALQSMSAVMETLEGQLFIIMLIVLVLAAIVSVAFSHHLSYPIRKLRKQAEKLSIGDYALKVEESEFREVNELNDAMVSAANDLSKIEDTRREVMANVTHDLKTPLTMIKAYAEMIKDISGNDEKMRNEHLDVIINETDNLNNQVTAILEYSKLQAGAIKIHKSEFDLTGAIEQSAIRFQTVADKDEIKVITEVEPELIAYGDEGKINEVLYNFISNALKHYGDDKTVIIKAYLENRDWIKVEITDHGPGIDPEILPIVWDRYVKSNKQYRRAQAGTGLGLAINKAILEEHGCKYGIISKVNEGSTFWFEIQVPKDED